MFLSLKGLLKQTTVRQNLSANLASKVLSALVSLACVPVYLRVLGVSGYGLIGVWTMLETLANLLDLGVSPTITRELAASGERGATAQDARDLVRTLEVGYWLVGLLIGATIVAGAPLIAAHWLQSSQLSTQEIRLTLVLIGILVLCRWPLSFYSGGLTGVERQVLLSWVTLAFTYVRSLGAVFVLIFVSPTIFAFFLWQIAINLAQTAAIAVLLWRCLPAGGAARFRLGLLRQVWKFAGGVTALSLVSIFLSDLDKLVVSRILPLEDFGYYSLGARIAGTLYMAASPVYLAFFPAFARFAAAKDATNLAAYYHRCAQVMSVLVMPAAITVVFFAKPLVFAWTGNELIAGNTALVAALLTAGTAINCIMTVPYALQLANGWTSLGFWLNLLYLPVTIPLLIVMTKHFGSAGAASSWLLINASYFGTGIPLMHRRLLKVEKWPWYLKDIAGPLVSCIVAGTAFSKLASFSHARVEIAIICVFVWGLLTVVAILVTPSTRFYVVSALRRHLYV